MSETNTETLTRRWLGILANKDFDAWQSIVGTDVQMRFPFAPPGIPAHCQGLVDCREMVRAFFAGIERFSWHDLEVFPSADPQLAFATAKSQVLLAGGKVYANEYCMMLRFRDGRLSEYREYFNPLPAIAAFT